MVYLGKLVHPESEMKVLLDNSPSEKPKLTVISKFDPL